MHVSLFTHGKQEGVGCLGAWFSRLDIVELPTEDQEVGPMAMAITCDMAYFTDMC